MGELDTPGSLTLEDMPESVLVRFTGSLQPGITLRDLVHAIPYEAIKRTPPHHVSAYDLIRT